MQVCGHLETERGRDRKCKGLHLLILLHCLWLAPIGLQSAVVFVWRCLDVWVKTTLNMLESLTCKDWFYVEFMLKTNTGYHQYYHCLPPTSYTYHLLVCLASHATSSPDLELGLVRCVCLYHWHWNFEPSPKEQHQAWKPIPVVAKLWSDNFMWCAVVQKDFFP